jgi:hypothetical protein
VLKRKQKGQSFLAKDILRKKFQLLQQAVVSQYILRNCSECKKLPGVEIYVTIQTETIAIQGELLSVKQTEWYAQFCLSPAVDFPG